MCDLWLNGFAEGILLETVAFSRVGCPLTAKKDVIIAMYQVLNRKKNA